MQYDLVLVRQQEGEISIYHETINRDTLQEMLASKVAEVASEPPIRW